LLVAFNTILRVETTINYNTVTHLQSLHTNLFTLSAAVFTYSVSLNHKLQIESSSHTLHLHIFTSLHLHIFTSSAVLLVSIRLEYSSVSADGLQDNSSERTPRKTVALLLKVCLPSRCIAMVRTRTTQKSSYVIPSQRLHWRSDWCLATSNNIRNSIVACGYSVVRCLLVRYLATL
jgi:hypothetical protein